MFFDLSPFLIQKIYVYKIKILEQNNFLILRVQ